MNHSVADRTPDTFKSEVCMLKAIRNLDYVVLLCDNILEMKQFYCEVMGFPIYRDWGSWIEMRVGSVLLALRHRDRPYDGPSFQPHSAAVQLAFRVAPAEVDACYTELCAQGVAILEPPISKDYGHRTLFFKDPAGNVLEIYADI
jgi:catechol 2,3-dioxygenase-like lactoylglutathione lyase family enzyme